MAELNGSFVLLDALRDRYIPLSLPQSQALRELLSVPSSHTSPPAHLALSATTLRYAEFFEQSGIIGSAHAHRPDRRLKENVEPITAAFEGWHLLAEHFDQEVSLLNVLRALWVVHHVHRQMRAVRLQGLIDVVERKHGETNLDYRSASEYAVLVAALNRACMLHPRRVTCLVWAVALVVLAAKEGGRLDLVVGVTRAPFYAHAWAESRGVVVGDDPNRRKQFAVICEVSRARTSQDVSQA